MRRVKGFLPAVIKVTLSDKISADKSAENMACCRTFCPPKNVVNRKFCPP